MPLTLGFLQFFFVAALHSYQCGYWNHVHVSDDSSLRKLVCVGVGAADWATASVRKGALHCANFCYQEK